MEQDQLLLEITKKNVFNGYIEGKIDFPPSYRYRIDTNVLTTKNRVPSYTDRILFSGKMKKTCSVKSYDTETDIVQSDHKPVFAQLEIEYNNKQEISLN